MPTALPKSSQWPGKRTAMAVPTYEHPPLPPPLPPLCIRLRLTTPQRAILPQTKNDDWPLRTVGFYEPWYKNKFINHLRTRRAWISTWSYICRFTWRVFFSSFLARQLKKAKRRRSCRPDLQEQPWYLYQRLHLSPIADFSRPIALLNLGQTGIAWDH